MLPSTRFERGIDVIAQRVQDDTVLFDMASGNYYSLNELGARVWELLDGKPAVSEVAAQLATEYDAPEETILEDLTAILKELAQAGLIVQSTGEDELAG